MGVGTVVLLIAAAVVIASSGVFYAYVKNRQINVLRDIQRSEERISQHELDIQTTQMLLAEQLNPILLRDRLRELNSDLRSIPLNAAREIESHPPGGAPGLAVAGPTAPSAHSEAKPSPSAGAAAPDLARRGP
jgi:hypothetical protein